MKKRNWFLSVSSVIRHRHSFTVIELLVSMSVFIILLGIVSNVFISSLRAQRTLVGLMAINDNVSGALEQMAREIRSGSNFCVVDGIGLCDPFDGNEVGSSIEFTAGGATVRYYITDDGVITRNDLPITSKNVRVVKAASKFRLGNLDLGSDWPPRITIALEVGSQQTQLQGFTTHMQTTVSSRDI